MKNGKRLPAKFIENRIFLQPKTKTGVTLNLITDSAGGRGIMTTKGVEKAGLPLQKKMVDSEEFITVELPEFVEDHWIPPLINDGKKAPLLVYDGGNEWEKNIAKEFDGQLGVTWFGNRIWTLDYLNQEMIYNENIDLSEIDKKYCVPLSFQKDEIGQLKYHYARIQAEINGEVLDFLFDTGATVHIKDDCLKELNDYGGKIRGTCFITEHIFTKWRSRHPEWRVIENAEEFSNYPMIEVPEVTIAGYTVGPVWFTYRPNYDFHEYMAQWLDQKVEGALGGSLFQYFKIIVDYPRERVIFEL